MEFYKENAEKLLKNLKFILPVLITALLSFGFVVTHSSVNVDTLAYDRYFDGVELLAQGRLTAPLLHRLFNVMNFNPFFVDTLAVIFLITSAVLWCLLLKRVSKNKFKDITYTVFACLFLSYPLICEIFTYTPASLSIALGYTFTVSALIIGYELMINKDKTILRLTIQSILLCLAVYLYESFAAVYLCGIFMIFIIEYVYNKERFKFLDLLMKGIVFVVPLIVAIILGNIIIKILWKVFDITESQNGAKTIAYLNLGIIGGIENLIKTFIGSYVLASTYYLPITVLAISFVIFVVLAIKNSIKGKSWIVLLLFIGLCVSVIALSIVQGMASPYRTCQTFAVFVAFAFMLCVQDILEKCNIKIINGIVLTLVFIVVFYQAKELHGQFYTNYLRYENEKNTVITIGNELVKNHDISKPVYFTGSYGYAKNVTDRLIVSEDNLTGKIYNKINNIMKKINLKYSYTSINDLRYGQTNLSSYINWSIKAFYKDKKANVELIKWFNLLGYDIKAGSKDIMDKVQKTSEENSNHFPKAGYIVETDEYIVVNF